jgi:hypothetical protein
MGFSWFAKTKQKTESHRNKPEQRIFRNRFDRNNNGILVSPRKQKISNVTTAKKPPIKIK